ncbi:unnamed protein product [Cuscuta campestris]|uniref:Reverse transcriptase domain-containing protein n=1 Tax=Cuscuta campestris TaxID=132261 RepID=A0A484LNM6_9ASTE|nr:unnamed protein product [Cuscuta campestris]
MIQSPSFEVSIIGHPLAVSVDPAPTLDQLEALLCNGSLRDDLIFKEKVFAQGDDSRYIRMDRLRKNDILFLFKREGDYLRWFSRRHWVINGISVAISKWSPDYSPTRESPIAPVWIKLEHYPVHLNDHGVLFKVASLFGKPIKLDSNTAIGVFPEQPRFCVERDTSLQFPSRLNVRLGCKDLWIPCKFENPPQFCSCCSIFGHNVNNCRKHKLSNLTGKAPAGEVGHKGAGFTEDLAGWTWVAIPKTGVPLPHAPPVVHTTYDQPSTSKQVKSHWSLLMPIIEDVNEDDALSQATPSPSHKHKSVPLPHHNSDDSLALVPYSSAPVVPCLASNLFSKDDYWLIFWNVCGVPSSIDRLISLKRIHTPSFFCLFEPKISASHISTYGLKLGFNNHLSSTNNKRWIFWDSSLLHLVSFDDEEQVTHCNFSMVNYSNSNLTISCVYGAHTVVERRQLWESLQGRSNLNHNWVVGGDFNAISSPSEFKGQCEPSALGMEELKSCIEACNLFCPDPSGGLFTWSGTRSRGKTWRRLDRVLVNLAFQSFFPTFYIHHLPKACSDHKAILFSCHSSLDRGPSSFRFLNAWIHHNRFLQVVKECWTKSSSCGGMHGLVAKLKDLKGCLREWNKNEFGNIFENLTMEDELATQTQQHYEADPTEANRALAQEANAKLLLATHREVAYWKQKANARWLESGDSNSKVFHAFANGKRRELAINHIISDDGLGLSTQTEICLEATTHFTKQIPSLDEVQQAVWDLDSSSASGPDGFNGLFFRSCWDIIKEDMLKASQEFFLGFPIPRAYGSTLISLIPKKDSPKRFDDYRPISLSTFMSKVNTKILSTRLKPLLPKLISSNQAAFQQGKSMADHILLAIEAAHNLDRKVFGGNMTIKIDIAKAFDNLRWDYLEAILKKGVKQGDPLSPLLFIIAGEGLSRMLNKSLEEGHIHPFNLGSVKMPGHLTYANDIMIFTKGDTINLLKLRKLLGDYSLDSGQVVNFTKSNFYVKTTTPVSQLANMSKSLAMEAGSLPFRYLGATICKGILRKPHCDHLVAHFDKHLLSWYSKTLNPMGRLILIKHVLSSIPLHVLTVHTIPASIINSLHSRMANFFWGSRNGARLHHWKSWTSLCQPSSSGGLGINDLGKMQVLHSINLWWRVNHDNGVWASLMRGIYVKKGDIKEKLTDSPTWKRICRVHALALSHYSGSSNPLLWHGKPFSPKNVLISIGDGLPCRLSCKYIWHSAQTPKLRIFQWKAFMGCLPFLDLAARFSDSLPSRCPLCKSHASLLFPQLARMELLRSPH